MHDHPDLPAIDQASAPPACPSRKQILDFIASSDQPAGKREIARAFGLSGQDKIELKRLLKDMADEGLIDSSPGPRVPPGGRRAEGHGAAGQPGRRQRPRVRGARAMARRNAAAAAARARARQTRRARHRRPRAVRGPRSKGEGWVAHPMKKLERSAELVLGVVKRRASASGCRRSTRRSGASCAISELEGRRSRRPRAVRGDRPPAAGHGAGRCGARRPVRAAQLLPDRDPQARAARTSSRRKRSTKRTASRSCRWASART